jgi:hypothetical protein
MRKIGRRSFIGASSALLAMSALPRPAAAQPALPDFYEEIEKRTFRYFWETADRRTGMAPDRWPSKSPCSIAAVGFALTCYAIGVERGWCSRVEARDLTLTTLRFFWNLPQGPQPAGVAGYKGFFYHFLDMETGLRFKQSELSTVDTTLLFLGVLFAGQYYDADEPVEAEIRQLADALYARADWIWFQAGRRAISMGWHPEKGFISRNWDGYNEGMGVLILGLGAPDRPLNAKSWEGWTAPYPRFWRGEGEKRHIAFGPMLGHEYSHLWIDFRGIKDAPMREAGFDYFENSRRAAYADRAYCAANPMGWKGYSENCWGLSACDGPGVTIGKQRFAGYAARGPVGQPDGFDDGTLAPMGALGCLPFAPEIVIPCAQTLLREQGEKLFGKYGFFDSFNPTAGWYDTDYIGIDQGPILAMAANYRNDFVWSRMRRVPAIRRGLELAGFKGGWLGDRF